MLSGTLRDTVSSFLLRRRGDKSMRLGTVTELLAGVASRAANR